ncbi:MAG: hypothetical protein LBC99_03820 [Spirochaetota bacterium]|jgi:hypothetical protein|nr:hypothetical protein [Spirochaetota bacterium]
MGKKLSVLLFAIILMLAVVACSGDTENPASSTGDTSASSDENSTPGGENSAASSAAASSAAASSAAVSSAAVSSVAPLFPPTNIAETPELAFTGADFETVTVGTVSGVAISRAAYDAGNTFFGNSCLLVRGTASGDATVYASPVMNRPDTGRDTISFWVKGTAVGSSVFFATSAANDNSATFGTGQGAINYAAIPLDGTRAWYGNFVYGTGNAGTYTDWTKIILDCTDKAFFANLQQTSGRTACFKIRVGSGNAINLYIDNVIYEGNASSGAGSSAASINPPDDIADTPNLAFSNAGFETSIAAVVTSSVGVSRVVYAEANGFFGNACLYIKGTASGNVRIYESPVMHQADGSKISFWVKGTAVGSSVFFNNGDSNAANFGGGANNEAAVKLNNGPYTWSNQFDDTAANSGTFANWTKITLDCAGKQFFANLQNASTTIRNVRYKIRVGSGRTIDLYIDNVVYEGSPDGGSSAGASSGAASSADGDALPYLIKYGSFTLPGGSDYGDDVPKAESHSGVNINYRESTAVYADSGDLTFGSCLRLTFDGSQNCALYQSPAGTFNTSSAYNKVTFYIKGTLTAGTFRILLTASANLSSFNRVFDIKNATETLDPSTEESPAYGAGSATFGAWTKITLNYTALHHSGDIPALQIRIGNSGSAANSRKCDLYLDDFKWE